MSILLWIYFYYWMAAFIYAKNYFIFYIDWWKLESVDFSLFTLALSYKDIYYQLLESFILFF